jgi:predicted ribosomally synthesized peptide with nif11-like leader
MEERLAQLQAKLEADKGLGEKLFSLETPEEVQGLLKEQGLDFSIEEIGVLKEALVKAVAKGDGSELSDADLEDVAGGSVTATVAIIGAVGALIPVVSGAISEAIRSRW